MMARKTIGKQINDLLVAEEYAKARKLIEAELAEKPEDHWLLTRLGTTYYEEGKYAKALAIARRAHELAPRCPLVLWDLAGSLDMTGDEKAAVAIYRQLLQRGVKAVANDECGEGAEWATALLTDCLYRLGACYQDLGHKRQALRHYRRFAELLAMGVTSLYSFADVQ